VPLSEPVVAVNVTPFGNVPLSVSVGVGEPVVVTVNVPGVPTVNTVLLLLMMAGGAVTMRVAVPGVAVFPPQVPESEVWVTVIVELPAGVLPVVVMLKVGFEVLLLAN
jgi:hypothetical protein